MEQCLRLTGRIVEVKNEVAFGIVEGFHIVTGKVKQDASVAPLDRLCDDLPNECRLTRAGCPGEHDMALLEPIRERERRDLIWHYDTRCFAISERKGFDLRKGHVGESFFSAFPYSVHIVPIEHHFENVI